MEVSFDFKWMYVFKSLKNNSTENVFPSCYNLISYVCILRIGSSSFGTGTASSSGIHLITNGICTFSPTSTRGKWIFLIQTIILSFAPIILLIGQNGYSFYSLMREKEEILHKSNLVKYLMSYQNNRKLNTRHCIKIAKGLSINSGISLDVVNYFR